MKKKVEAEMLGFCIKCGSTNLKMVETPWKVRTGQFWQSEMKCLNCGYEGLVLEGNKSFLEQYKKNFGEQK